MRLEGLLQGRLKAFGVYAGVAVAILLLYLIFMVAQFRALTDINAIDYAQIGRNLAQGKGFTTSFLKPLSLARVQTKQGEPHPDLSYPPLHPLALSILLRVAGADPTSQDRAVALGSGIPFLLTVVVVFVLGIQLFDRRVAWLAVAMFATNLAVLRLAISGLEASLLGLLVSLLLLFLYLQPRVARQRLPYAALAGLTFGLTYLTKTEWAVAFVPILVYLWYAAERRERAKTLAVFCAVSLVVVLPWLIRMQTVAGNPFASLRWQEMLTETRTNPGNTLYRTYADAFPSPVSFIASHPREVYEKVRAGIGNMYPTLATMAGPYLSAFFIVAIIVPLGRSGFERLRYLMYAMFLLVFIALAFVQPAARLLMPLAPAVTVIGCGFFFRILQPRLEPYAPKEYRLFLSIAVGILVALQATPTLLTVTLPPPDNDTQRQLSSWCQQVAEATDGPIITDIPWLVAWYGNRDAIWLPRTLNDLYSLERSYGEVKWLVLTPVAWNARGAERTEEWANLWQAALRNKVTWEGFTATSRLADGSWILFKRQERPSPAQGQGS
jgi:4-amino-4-deoxy-L-arabinose transferase-like glycosyltransferase